MSNVEFELTSPYRFKGNMSNRLAITFYMSKSKKREMLQNQFSK